MFDSTAILPTMTADWQAHLAPGDIVSFRFPVAQADPAENPKSRPCLVLEIEELAGARFALIAYGTTSPGKANRGYEIHAFHEADYPSFGLDRPTRFVGQRRMLVGLDDPAFVLCRDTGSPVLGRLSGGPAERLLAVRARLQAETDIAADRRATRRRERRRERPVQRRAA